ncbi:MAG: hypothetical protein AABZ58_10725 [Chloroflexota bacterium]|nr:hypothetical protein [Anaerolineales bacterium]
MNNEEAKDEEQIACPFCGSTETEFFSLFGQFLLTSQYYCRNCRTVFDVVRWTEDEPQPSTE